MLEADVLELEDTVDDAMVDRPVYSVEIVATETRYAESEEKASSPKTERLVEVDGEPYAGGAPYTSGEAVVRGAAP